ncbi:MAG: PD-(D/E)XK nuclease family protein [Fibrobacterota bacterium]
MDIQIRKYPFTKELGWSNSRYDLFTRCRRAYYYNYYGKFLKTVPYDKILFLKKLTSVPLETGNVIHHMFETFLKRLMKSPEPVNAERFIAYGRSLCEDLFAKKTFMETYYDNKPVDTAYAADTVSAMLQTFLESRTYDWILQKAQKNTRNWIIEPGGFGETRLDGLKAYCKMDFLIPDEEEDCIRILDWKSGRKHIEKHSRQLLGYAAAIMAENPHIRAEQVKPEIVYVTTEVIEPFSTEVTHDAIRDFLADVHRETAEMKACCVDAEKNIPLPVEEFPGCGNEKICRFCQFREICDVRGQQAQEVLPF